MMGENREGDYDPVTQDMIIRSARRKPFKERTNDQQALIYADDENKRLKVIGRRLLYHDERGQGIGWRTTMEDLRKELQGDSDD